MIRAHGPAFSPVTRTMRSHDASTVTYFPRSRRCSSSRCGPARLSRANSRRAVRWGCEGPGTVLPSGSIATTRQSRTTIDLHDGPSSPHSAPKVLSGLFLNRPYDSRVAGRPYNFPARLELEWNPWRPEAEGVPIL